MPEDKYIKIKVKTLVNVVSSLLLILLIPFWCKLMYNANATDWGMPSLSNQIIIVIATVLIIVSVHWVLFCLKDGWKWLKPFTSKRGVFWISTAISAFFCFAGIRALFRMMDALPERAWTVYLDIEDVLLRNRVIAFTSYLLEIGYYIVRAVAIVFIALLAYKMFMKIYNKPKKIALETN